MWPVTEIAGFELRWYGLLLLTGLACGAIVVWREALRRGHPAALAWSGARWVIVGALLGAHLPYWVLGLASGGGFRWTGAASFHGALLGGGLALLAFVRRRGLPLLETLDVACLALPLGHGIGRLGCFLAGCCWGQPTGLPWAVVFTHEKCFAPTGVALHPTQLYELGLELGLFAFLWWRRLRPHAIGSLAFTYGLVFGLGRFLIEFLRADPGRGRPFGGALSLTQLLSLGLVLASVLGFLWLRRQPAGSEAT